MDSEINSAPCQLSVTSERGHPGDGERFEAAKGKEWYGSAEHIGRLVNTLREGTLTLEDRVAAAEFLHYFHWMSLKLEKINHVLLKALGQ